MIINRVRADLLLLLTALIWGTAFIAQKSANETMGPITFVGTRFFLSAFALLPLALHESQRQTTPLTIQDWMLASVIGLCLFVGSCLQQAGLLTTSVTHGGFLTALYVVFVPFVVWATKGEPPRKIVMIACIVSVTGAWLLTKNGQAAPWVVGDILLIIADIGWAFAIALVPLFLKRTNRPFFLSCMQYGVTAILGLIAGSLCEPVSRQGIMQALPDILYAGLVSGGIAYTLGILAQRHTPPAEAALIMSLESVFAAIAGAILLHESLTLMAMIGCALILFGVALCETAPFWQRQFRKGRRSLSKR